MIKKATYAFTEDGPKIVSEDCYNVKPIKADLDNEFFQHPTKHRHVWIPKTVYAATETQGMHFD